jgi:hypothetical protein
MKAAALIIVVISLLLPALNGQQPRLMLPSGIFPACPVPPFHRMANTSSLLRMILLPRSGAWQEGQLLLDLGGHLSDVNSAVFSPDGKKNPNGFQ